jgi:hypothetical protein
MDNNIEIQREDWCIKQYDHDFYLEYRPSTIEKLGASYVVNKKIYDEVKNSAITLEQLIKKYDILNKFEKLYSFEEGLTGDNIPPNTETFYCNGSFIVTDENGEYYIEYQLSRQGGGSRKFKINKQIYDDARTGNFATTDLFIKYNLYQFDIPENDVK